MTGSLSNSGGTLKGLESSEDLSRQGAPAGNPCDSATAEGAFRGNGRSLYGKVVAGRVLQCRVPNITLALT
jgi:hypothetical protein